MGIISLLILSLLVSAAFVVAHVSVDGLLILHYAFEGHLHLLHDDADVFFLMLQVFFLMSPLLS